MRDDVIDIPFSYQLVLGHATRPIPVQQRKSVRELVRHFLYNSHYSYEPNYVRMFHENADEIPS
jgi:hypothetical protein